MNHKLFTGTAIIGLSFILIAGCGRNSVPSASTDPNANQPVSLVFWTGEGNYGDQTIYDTEMGNFITKKYPNITIDHIHTSKGQGIQELVTAGKYPDIVMEALTLIPQNILQYGLQNDMQELFNKYKFDLSGIDPAIVMQIKNSNSDKKIIGLPFQMSNYMLYYNKDVFDKFGVPYPKDGMSWDDIYNVAQALTRNDGGTQYMGFDTNINSYFKFNQLSLNSLDAKEDKAALNNDAWKNLFDNLRRFYELPGATVGGSYPAVYSAFNNGTLAMALGEVESAQIFAKNPDLHWDVVSYPTFKELPGIGAPPHPYYLFVTSSSQHKDQAFQVVSQLLSTDTQLNLSKQGIQSPLKDKNIEQSFGQDVSYWKGKNIQALYYDKLASPPPARANGLVNVNPDIVGSFINMVKQKQDTNTALRNLDDATNQLIQTTKTQQ